MTPAGIAILLVVSAFAFGALTIALYSRRSFGANIGRSLWPVYFSTVTIAAAILLPAIIHPLLFSVVVALAAIRCSVEIAAIHGERAPTVGLLALTSVMLGVAWASAGLSARDMALLMYGSIMIIVLASPAIWHVLAGPPGKVSIWIVAVSFPALAAAHLSHAISCPDGVLWIFLLYATVETQDSMAFLFGRLFGRTPVAPQLSPHKTLEGTLAGAAFGTAMGTTIAVFLLNLSLPSAAAVAVLLVAAGLVGDVFTSRLKRVAGVKDFPAVHTLHGGIMDIYDSTLFAALPLSAAQFLLLPTR